MIWFHIYCENHWFDIAAETLVAIRDAVFDGNLRIHIVGSPSEASTIADLAGHIGLSPQITLHEENQFEFPTLNALWKHSQHHNDSICYIHSKGASRTWPVTTKWRWMMIDQIICNWKTRVQDLESYDAVGCCYRHDGAFFAGNWWWARGDWIKSLAEPHVSSNRFDFERWLLSRSGARIKSLVSLGGEPYKDEYYSLNGNPHLRFLNR